MNMKVRALNMNKTRIPTGQLKTGICIPDS